MASDSQQPSESPIFPSEITVSDGEENKLPIEKGAALLRRSKKLQQGDKDLEIFCLEQELEAAKEDNGHLKLTIKSHEETIRGLNHKIQQLEAKKQGEKWFGENEQFTFVTKRGMDCLFGGSPEMPQKQPRTWSPSP